MTYQEAVSDAPSKGVKNDEGKLRWDLLPASSMEELVRVYTIGAAKYTPYNWMKGLDYGRIFAAMMRHAWAFWRGEQRDQVDGQHHLASVAWCALTLLYYDKDYPTYTSFDDRPSGSIK
jgi:hypothetical protein